MLNRQFLHQTMRVGACGSIGAGPSICTRGRCGEQPARTRREKITLLPYMYMCRYSSCGGAPPTRRLTEIHVRISSQGNFPRESSYSQRLSRPMAWHGHGPWPMRVCATWSPASRTRSLAAWGWYGFNRTKRPDTVAGEAAEAERNRNKGKLRQNVRSNSSASQRSGLSQDAY